MTTNPNEKIPSPSSHFETPAPNQTSNTSFPLPYAENITEINDVHATLSLEFEEEEIYYDTEPVVSTNNSVRTPAVARFSEPNIERRFIVNRTSSANESYKKLRPRSKSKFVALGPAINYRQNELRKTNTEPLRMSLQLLDEDFCGGLCTPFARILRKLNSAQNSLDELIKFVTVREGKKLRVEDEISIGGFASKASADIKWCSLYVKRMEPYENFTAMASREIKHQLAGEFKGANKEEARQNKEVSDYIFQTFLDGIQDEIEDWTLCTETDDTFATSVTIEESPRFLASANDLDTPVLPSETIINNAASKIANRAYDTLKAIKETIVTNGCPNMTESILDENDQKVVVQYLNQNAEKWSDFNCFEFDKLTKGQPLSYMTFYALRKRRLLSRLRIPEKSLWHFLLQIEHLYPQNNPYHNRIHACDVTHASYYFLNAPSFKGVFTDMEYFSTILAAAVHDVNHPGVSSQFIINSLGELAICYNDMSVLENHHLACTFTVLFAPKNIDLFKNTPRKQFLIFRKSVIELVLATDMTKHVNIVTEFTNMIQMKCDDSQKQIELESFADRIHVLQMLVHCADLSNAGRPFIIYYVWAELVVEEFYRQGDIERACGMDVSPMCDRKCGSLNSSQFSFIEYIVEPLYMKWCELIGPHGHLILDHISENKVKFSDKSNSITSSVNKGSLIKY